LPPPPPCLLPRDDHHGNAGTTRGAQPGLRPSALHLAAGGVHLSTGAGAGITSGSSGSAPLGYWTAAPFAVVLAAVAILAAVAGRAVASAGHVLAEFLQPRRPVYLPSQRGDYSRENKGGHGLGRGEGGEGGEGGFAEDEDEGEGLEDEALLERKATAAASARRRSFG
jgi:hypothetical protein